MDEFEALRLADYQGLDQKEASKSMRISQQTFSRILKKARYLVAKGITTGSAIRIQGGQYVISSRLIHTKENPNPNTVNHQENLDKNHSL